MTDHEKTLVELHKQILLLHYNIAKYEMDGLDPPDNLLKKFHEVQRKVRIVSLASAK